MIINSITLKNFQCFYDEVKFEFNEGLNFVLAANGHGKSKLFDAFYWVINNSIIGSDGRPILTSEVKHNLINKKALMIAENNESIKTRVILDLEHNNENYQIIRDYGTIKTKDDESVSWKDDNDSERRVQKFNKHRATYEPYYNKSEADEVITNIFPSNIRQYLWFQGEQGIDRLLDFQNPKALNDAIEVLSDITELNKIVKISDYLFEKINSEIQDYQNRYAQDKEEMRKLNERKNEKEKLVKELKEEIGDLNERISNVEDEKSGVDAYFSEFVKIKDLDNQKNKLEAEISNIERQIQDLRNEFIDHFFNRYWILKGSESEFQKFREKCGEYEKKLNQERNKENNLNNILPEDVPDITFLKQMLEEKRCGLCQSPAPEGSPQYDHIKKRKEQQEKYISNNLEFQHEDEIKLLKDEAFHFIKNAGKVDKDFQDYLQKIAELEDSIEEYKESLSKIKEDINQHLKSYDVDISNVEELLRKREKFDNELKYLNNQKGDKKGKIEEQQQELKKINYQIQMKSPKEVSEKLEIENELAKDLNDICNSSKEREYKRLLQHLEEQANSYFEKINKGSGAFFGKIKIRETNKGYSPIIENEYHQNVTKRVSTSIRQSLKISMIMAISSLNNDLNNRYPTISDAATSNFDDMKMLNYYVQTANAFNQSIVITKDFINQDNGKGWYFNQEQFDNLKENLNQNLGNVYLLKIPEEVDINKEEQILVKKEKIY